MADLQRVKPGGDLSIKADTFNSILDVTKFVQNNMMGAIGDGIEDLSGDGLIMVKNSTGADRAQWNVVVVDAPLITAADNEDEFTLRVACDTELATVANHEHWQNIAILQEPITNGKIGKAVVSGLTIAKVKQNAAAHQYAVPGTDAGYLESAATGPVRILWIAAGVGSTQWAIVHLGHTSGSERWKRMGGFNATPPSTSTITTTVDLSGIIKVGMPLKFTLAAGDFYAIVTAISSSLITIAGAPLTTGADTLLALYYGDPEMISVLSMFISGTFGDGTNSDLLASDMKSPFKWMQSKFHLVAVSATQASVDTGSEAVINVQINNANVMSTGITLGAAGAWVNGWAVAITPANYDANYGEEIEVACTTAGGTGDAEDLTVQCVFVPE